MSQEMTSPGAMWHVGHLFHIGVVTVRGK